MLVVERVPGAAAVKAKAKYVKTSPETVKKTSADTAVENAEKTVASGKPVSAQSSTAEGKDAS